MRPGAEYLTGSNGSKGSMQKKASTCRKCTRRRRSRCTPNPSSAENESILACPKTWQAPSFKCLRFAMEIETLPELCRHQGLYASSSLTIYLRRPSPYSPSKATVCPLTCRCGLCCDRHCWNRGCGSLRCCRTSHRCCKMQHTYLGL